MYYLVQFALAALFLILGFVMVIAPKKVTKKSLRDSEDAVKKIKRNGFLVIVLGVLFDVSVFIQLS